LLWEIYSTRELDAVIDGWDGEGVGWRGEMIHHDLTGVVALSKYCKWGVSYVVGYHWEV
jgi:hypothetical protein